MIGKLSKINDCRQVQRDAIAKLESIHGGEAVTITKVRECAWMAGGYVLNVIFDTGPRRMDFVTESIDSMGWRFVRDGDGWDWVAVTTHADYAMKLDAMKFKAA